MLLGLTTCDHDPQEQEDPPAGNVPDVGTGDSPEYNAATKSNFVVRVNVGGTIFYTTIDTLTCINGSYFADYFGKEEVRKELLSQIKANDDESCLYFIDRDPLMFPQVLNYMRAINHSEISAKICVATYNLLSPYEKSLLFQEALFYNLKHLMEGLDFDCSVPQTAHVATTNVTDHQTQNNPSASLNHIQTKPDAPSSNVDPENKIKFFFGPSGDGASAKAHPEVSTDRVPMHHSFKSRKTGIFGPSRRSHVKRTPQDTIQENADSASPAVHQDTADVQVSSSEDLNRLVEKISTPSPAKPQPTSTVPNLNPTPPKISSPTLPPSDSGEFADLLEEMKNLNRLAEIFIKKRMNNLNRLAENFNNSIPNPCETYKSDTSEPESDSKNTEENIPDFPHTSPTPPTIPTTHTPKPSFSLPPHVLNSQNWGVSSSSRVFIGAESRATLNRSNCSMAGEENLLDRSDSSTSANEQT